MRFLSRLRHRLHTQILHKKLEETKVLPLILPQQAKTVAIVYEASSVENRKIIGQFAEQLRYSGKKVTLLGFYSLKEKPNAYGRFFSQKEVTWKGVPKSPEVDAFLNETFDLLYALYIGEHLPLGYVSSLCKAHFKIGAYNPHLEHYDLMISTANQNLSHFIKLVELNLHKISQHQYELSAV